MEHRTKEENYEQAAEGKDASFFKATGCDVDKTNDTNPMCAWHTDQCRIGVGACVCGQWATEAHPVRLVIGHRGWLQPSTSDCSHTGLPPTSAGG